jgi:hypothetical protein
MVFRARRSDDKGRDWWTSKRDLGERGERCGVVVVRLKTLCGGGIKGGHSEG